MLARRRYDGRFTAKKKHPDLHVNGEYDPVNPPEHVQRASRGFEGSVILAHWDFGHGFFVDPSTCIQKHMQAYCKGGVLPEPGVQCEPDSSIWGPVLPRGGRRWAPRRPRRGGEHEDDCMYNIPASDRR